MNAAAWANLNKGAKSWASPSRHLLYSPLRVKMFHSSPWTFTAFPLQTCLPVFTHRGEVSPGRSETRGQVNRRIHQVIVQPWRKAWLLSRVCVWHMHPQTLTCTVHRQMDTNAGTLEGCGSKQTSNNGSSFGISPLDLHRPSYITRHMWNYWKSQTQEIKRCPGNSCKQLSMLQTLSE